MDNKLWQVEPLHQEEIVQSRNRQFSTVVNFFPFTAVNQQHIRNIQFDAQIT